VERVAALQEELKGSLKALAAARGELAVAKAAGLVNKVKPLEGTQFSILVERVDGIEGPDLQKVAKNLQEKLGPSALVMVTGVPSPGKVGFGTAFGPKAVESGANARNLTSVVAKICGGGGGGSDSLAQAGGKDESALPEALSKARKRMKAMIITVEYGGGIKQIRQSARFSDKPEVRGGASRFVGDLIRSTISKRNRTPKVAD
jgi:alanyl-tRNA synthetase